METPDTSAEPTLDQKGALLLEIARETVRQEALGLGEPASSEGVSWDAPWLREPGATFVTLRKHGELRGCLGTLVARRPLLDDVCSNARAVVSRDPRFPRVAPDELPELAVEVSLLSALVEVRCKTETEALRELDMNRCGWVLEYRTHNGTFLPQVWEMLPRPRDFWHRLKEKAGLRPDFWDPRIRLWRYSVAKWASEPEASDPAS